MGRAKAIAREGLPSCQRRHIHFYECGREGNLSGGRNVRIGSDVGIVFYSAPNGVILS